jgi:hypothetical protein
VAELFDLFTSGFRPRGKAVRGPLCHRIGERVSSTHTGQSEARRSRLFMLERFQVLPIRGELGLIRGQTITLGGGLHVPATASSTVLLVLHVMNWRKASHIEVAPRS